jgi:uncharacterized protein DUF1835
MTTTAAKPLPAGVHIILGDSAGGTFTRIHRARDRLLVDQDVLCCGPTPKCDDLRAWKEVRHEYWTTLVPGADREHVHSPFNLDDNAERLRSAEHICIWAATSLSEQLFIAHVIHLVDLVGADPARISVIQFETLRGRDARVLGMGELNEENMSAHPDPVPLSKDTLADYRAAWSALTSDDPAGFERFAGERPGANTWLKSAMQLMLRRFPDARTGLSYWDSVLLKYVREHGPRAARIIGQTMAGEWDDGDLTGDSYLFGRLLRLGDERLPKPLLHLTGSKSNMRTTELALTPFGEAVLDGQVSNYPTNPIDDWAGGVKLSSADGALWFSDGGRIVRDRG